MPRTAPKTVDEYIAGFPPETQTLLQKVRQTIKKAAPKAEEKISYQIPAFTLKGGVLIYFAGFKNHISVYPAPRGYEQFKELLAGYKGGKGTVQFPLDKPIPFSLITKIVKFRAKEALAQAEAKAKKK